MGDDRAVITGEHAKNSYSSLAYEINRLFCEKKGWDFRYEKYALPQRPWGVWQGYSREASEHRAPTWIKLLAVHSALQRNHDYVIWIDSDCIFYNHDRSWDAILGEFSNPMLHLIGWLDNPFHSDKFCAGFFIVRNSWRSEICWKPFGLPLQNFPGHSLMNSTHWMHSWPNLQAHSHYF